MSRKQTPAERDGKKVPLNSVAAATLPFLGTAFVVTPLWLSILVPLSVISLGWKRLTTPSKMRKLESTDNLRVQKQASDKSGRNFDLVLFGATGFTGRLSALYLAKTYGNSNLKWAIAGRRRDALEAIRNELAQINPKLKDLPIILADSNDHASIDAMVTQTTAVITTSGPFARYGKYLVQSCAVHGTHYCDITGETDFVRETIDLYDDLARQSGAYIVSSCGNDCVPWDLLLLQCSKKVTELNKTDKIVKFNCYVEGNFEPSGGTLETALGIFNDRTKLKTRLGFDPMLKDPTTGQEVSNRISQKHPTFLTYEPRIKRWIAPFFMTPVMASCLKRSNALLKYSEKIVYREGMVFPNFFAAFTFVMGMVAFGTALTIPPFLWLLRKFVLPAPGQGPSDQTMDAGYLQLTAYATTAEGREVKGLMYFPTDAGYRDTARMLVESGLVFALEANKVGIPGGVYTPAGCQGDLLTARLLKTGTSLEIETVEKKRN